jgi:succinate dehydrogenase / fumarate reductase membrane anchor subunit
MTTTTLPNQITVRKIRRRPRSLESYAWLFMRLSGAGLLLLAVGHWVMIHFIQGVQNVTGEWVTEARWAYTWIRVWDFLLLGLAFVHGLNGFHTVVTDYIHNKTALKIVRLLIVAVGVVITILGAAAIIFMPMK